MSDIKKYDVELTEEEFKLLYSLTEYHSDLRCKCGHLWALHNGHCCSFCLVPGCGCEKS